MNRSRALCLLATLISMIFLSACHAGAARIAAQADDSPSLYCLFVTVDGLDRDYVAAGAAPMIEELAREGVHFPDAINAFPTLTTPNMASIVTGAWPFTTTIGSNREFFKDEQRIVSAPRHNKAVTIAEVFAQAGLSTAAVQHFMLQNRGVAEDDYVQIQGGKSADITNAALKFLNRESPPRLLAVLYQEVDSVGHKHGARGKETLAMMRAVDAEVASLVAAYRNRGLWGRTLFVLTSDHGMSHKERPINVDLLHQRIKDGGWKVQVLGANTTPDPDADFYWIQMANGQCYFNRSFSNEERERLFAAIRSVDGIGTIHDELALRRMSAHPSAGDFIVEPVPGWWFGGGMGVHGRNTESDLYMMMSGPGIRRGAAVMGARTIDAVPTILHLMGLPQPRTIDGKVLWEALVSP